MADHKGCILARSTQTNKRNSQCARHFASPAHQPGGGTKLMFVSSHFGLFDGSPLLFLTSESDFH